MSKANPRKEAREAMQQARAAARRNDLTAAERWSKTAERMAQAAEKLASLPPALNDPAEEERMRQNLREKIARLVEHHDPTIAWEHQAIAFVEAERRGEAVAPLPAHPMGPIAEMEALESIRAHGRIANSSRDAVLERLRGKAVLE